MVGTAKNGIEVLRILKDKPADVEDALDAGSVHKVRYLRYACPARQAHLKNAHPEYQDSAF